MHFMFQILPYFSVVHTDGNITIFVFLLRIHVLTIIPPSIIHEPFKLRMLSLNLRITLEQGVWVWVVLYSSISSLDCSESNVILRLEKIVCVIVARVREMSICTEVVKTVFGWKLGWMKISRKLFLSTKRRVVYPTSMSTCRRYRPLKNSR